MTRSLPSFLAACLLAAVPAASHAAPNEPARRVLNRIVAIVDDQVITLRELDRKAAPVIAQTAPAEAPKQRAAVLQELIDAELLAAEADRRKISADRAEIDAALAAVAKQNNLSVPELIAAAGSYGIDEATYRAELRRQIVEMRVASMWLSEEVLRGVTPPTTGIEGARALLLAKLRANAFVEVRL